MELLYLAWLIVVILVIVTIVRDDGSAGHKILWVLLVLFVPLIGIILYFVIGNSTKRLGA